MNTIITCMNTIKISTTQNIEVEYELASIGERITGYIIDKLIMGAYIIVITITSISRFLPNRSDIGIFVLIIPLFFYDLACETLMNGQSVGKKAMNIKVVSLNGRQPTLGQYIIRWLFRLIDFSITGNLCALICVAASERKQRLGDMIAGTTLVRTFSRTGFHQTLYVPTPDEAYTVSFPEVAGLSDKDMQLIREVISEVQRTGNDQLAFHAKEKIMKTLNLNSAMEPIKFLQVLLSDFNYLTARQ